MARTTNKEIMELLVNINNTLSSLEERVSNLENGTSTSSKTSLKSQKKAPKSTPKSAPKSSKVNLADFEPKKDKDGYYNWASYKACRRRYVETVSGKILHGKDGEWLDGEAFKNYAKDFDKVYKYVKLENR